MSHFEDIYAGEADTYNRLIAAEDAHGELARKVTALAEGATSIVDIGTGTGRLSVACCQAGKRVHGVDVAKAMLDVAATKLTDCEGKWALSVGDARNLPIADDWADAALAGWVYGHFTEFWPDSWEQDLDKAITEMDRVVRPGGVEVVIDTLGTATEAPAAPAPLLADYHTHLESIGFEKTVLRTDYHFASVDESIELLDWFFGLGDWARTNDDALVPEFTGWWQRTNDQPG